jgi:N-formylglutamate amidohydrolase
MSDLVPGVYKVEGSREPSLPVIFDSPHSGTNYPPDFGFIAPSELVRRAEDAYVDELFSAAPARGAPLVSALFPRSYIDPNRSLLDLDPEVLAEPWPDEIAPGEKARLGHGLIWRLCPPDEAMYDRKLSVEEVRRRIDLYWKPYHAALKRVLDDVHHRFGQTWHINCHSMPAISPPNSPEGATGVRRAEIVLGDRDGSTCLAEFLALVRDTFKKLGYQVKVNDPYKGVEIVRAYSDPLAGRHALQIEINRALYMDEQGFEKTAGFAELQANLTKLIDHIGDYALSQVAAAKAAE